ncbi:MAG: hypothetical protein JWR80_9327 [Bradyrhizobium sp.]|nr:hypothetical protein [Bradyrhizobium sp.]
MAAYERGCGDPASRKVAIRARLHAQGNSCSTRPGPHFRIGAAPLGRLASNCLIVGLVDQDVAPARPRWHRCLPTDLKGRYRSTTFGDRHPRYSGRVVMTGTGRSLPCRQAHPVARRCRPAKRLKVDFSTRQVSRLPGHQGNRSRIDRIRGRHVQLDIVPPPLHDRKFLFADQKKLFSFLGRPARCIQSVSSFGEAYRPSALRSGGRRPVGFDMAFSRIS